ncbi:MAG: glycoside hydrolase family 16 protein [Planctomycetota bacterium]|nr:glycoside hydrolase family 16 protein [Planctomycetota bacterium]
MKTSALVLAALVAAAGSFSALAPAAAVPQAPERPGYVLTFHDEFDGDKLNREVWDCEAASPGHIQSSRWPENVKVEGGLLKLLTKKESRGGKDWTSASIRTKTFKQKCGYFEARIRIAGATGLNNAFWLMTRNKKTDPVHFEVDIIEAHYPDKVNTNLHNWAGEHWAKSKTWKAPVDLSKDFHVYALEWTENQLVWFVDGQEIRRQDHTICQDAAPVRLSTAVMPWAGKPADDLDGKSMDVDWVRVYSRK